LIPRDPAEPEIVRAHWTTLEPIGSHNLAEALALDELRSLTPTMGGATRHRSFAGRFAPAVAIRDNQSGRVIGVLENDEMAGYAGVAVFVIFVDQQQARPGYALEAVGIYVPTLFAHGATLVHLEILEFNRGITHILDHRRQAPQVRMRRHAYVGGRFWDLLIYGFDAEEWEAMFGKFNRLLPGGVRTISALGGGRRD
jgi:hypothetical protein